MRQQGLPLKLLLWCHFTVNASSAPIYYHRPTRPYNYESEYWPSYYGQNYYMDSSGTQRQISVDAFADLTLFERASMMAATLSIIGLSYLSSRTQSADLQLQVDSLRTQVTNLQYNLNGLQSSVSSLSDLVSSSSSSTTSVDSAVLQSTCNTLKSITSIEGPVATTRDITTYLRTLILVDDPVCS